MAVYNFTLYEVDYDYYGSEDGEILSQTTLAISDTDNLLHSSPTTDPATDQLFSIGGGAYTGDYEIQYQDFSQIDGSGPEYEMFAFIVNEGGPNEKYYVFSKDPGFNPNVGDDLSVSRYSTFTNTNYNDIGSAICFGSGTLIRTPCGARPIETLVPGDIVLTATAGPQPILWRGSRHVRRAQMEHHPGLVPIVLREGVCGNDAELRVSQQHAISTRRIAALSHRFPDHLVRAKHLAEYCRGARFAKGTRQVSYHHLLLPSHALIWANGALTESLRIAPMSLRILGRAQMATLFQTRDDLTRGMMRDLSARAERPVRKILSGAQVRATALRRASLPLPATAVHQTHSAALKCAPAQPIT